MKEMGYRLLYALGGAAIGFIGHIVYEKVRHPMGRVKVKKFVPLDEEL